MAESKTTCPDECIGWTEAHLDSRLNESYYAHQASGAESIAAQLRAKAGKLFAKGGSRAADDKAGLYREIAEWVEEQAKGWRAAQKKSQLETQQIIEEEEADA
jgi:hypothetical protein